MILHLDADCFFASCEMANNPSLKTKPLMVGDSICIAKNYVAKSFGITTGMPVWEAKVKCPNLVVLPVNFPLYEPISQAMFNIAGEESDKMEIASIDECFLDLRIHEEGRKQNARQWYINFANALRTKVENQLDITISIGIAETKTLAKIASDVNKPSGIKIVLPSDREAFLKSFPISAVPGIGKKQTPKMLMRGLTTPWDYTQKDLPTIRGWFNRPGINHWWELKGVQMLPVTPGHTHPKSIVRTRSFKNPTTNLTQVWNSYVEHTQRILTQLQAQNLTAKKIWIHLRHKDFTIQNFETVLPNSTSFYPTLITAVKKLYGSCAPKTIEYRSTGVGVTELRPVENYQYSLFEGVNSRGEMLEEALEKINAKWGVRTIGRGEVSISKHAKPSFDPPDPRKGRRERNNASSISNAKSRHQDECQSRECCRPK